MLTTRLELTASLSAIKDSFHGELGIEANVPSRFTKAIRLLEDEGECCEQKVQDSVNNSFEPVSMRSQMSKHAVKSIPMYSDIRPQIGERNKSLVGLEMARMNTSLGVRFCCSLDRRFEFPVSLRRRSVLRSKRTGAYVSRMIGAATIETTPMAIANTQKIHRHPAA